MSLVVGPGHNPNIPEELNAQISGLTATIPGANAVREPTAAKSICHTGVTASSLDAYSPCQDSKHLSSWTQGIPRHPRSPYFLLELVHVRHHRRIGVT